mgnify:CR=1 FL=1
MTQQSVVVLMGGWSAERDVSLSSGRGIEKSLKDMGYAVRGVDVTEDTDALLQSLTPKPDVVFNALHGTGGEDGVIQGFLDVLKIPYTHSGVASSALAMDKVLSRRIFENIGLATPAWKVVSRKTLKEDPPFEKPFVLKPLKNGSSHGVHIVTDELPPNILSDDWPFGDDVLVEAYLPGREIQVAIMGDKALGAIEIRPKTGFYDYKAKYTEGFAEHFMPAPIEEEDYTSVLSMALRTHRALGCKDISRVDFILHGGVFHILELNTHPGMTPLSLVPEIAAHAGISFPHILRYLIDNAAYRT